MTDLEINVMMAEWCGIEIEVTDGEVVRLVKNGESGVYEWDPLRDGNDCGEVMDAIGEMEEDGGFSRSHSVHFSKRANTWQVCINDGHGQLLACVAHQDKWRAVCLAVVKMLEASR